MLNYYPDDYQELKMLEPPQTKSSSQPISDSSNNTERLVHDYVNSSTITSVRKTKLDKLTQLIITERQFDEQALDKELQAIVTNAYHEGNGRQKLINSIMRTAFRFYENRPELYKNPGLLAAKNIHFSPAQWLGWGHLMIMRAERSIDLEEYSLLPNMDFKQWQALSMALNQISPISLDVANTAATNLNDQQFDILCRLISNLPIIDLQLDNNGLCELKFENWQKLTNAIINSSVKFVGLGNNSLGKAIVNHSEIWDLVCSLLQKSNPCLETFDLEGNELFNLSVNNWHTFCRALNNCSLQMIRLGDNNLGYLDLELWNHLCHSLEQTPNLKKLDMTNNALDKLSTYQWRTFGELLINNNRITSLNLASNSLSGLNPKQLQAFIPRLQQSNIRSLDLTDNNIGEQITLTWYGFCLMTKVSRIHSLNLCSNGLGNIDRDQWEIFCNGIQASGVNRINLVGHNIDNHDHQYWHKLAMAMGAGRYSNIVGYAFHSIYPSTKLDRDSFHRLVQHPQKALNNAAKLISCFNVNPGTNEFKHIYYTALVSSQLARQLGLPKEIAALIASFGGYNSRLWLQKQHHSRINNDQAEAIAYHSVSLKDYISRELSVLDPLQEMMQRLGDEGEHDKLEFARSLYRKVASAWRLYCKQDDDHINTVYEEPTTEALRALKIARYSEWVLAHRFCQKAISQTQKALTKRLVQDVTKSFGQRYFDSLLDHHQSTSQVLRKFDHLKQTQYSGAHAIWEQIRACVIQVLNNKYQYMIEKKHIDKWGPVTRLGDIDNDAVAHNIGPVYHALLLRQSVFTEKMNKDHVMEDIRLH